MYFLKHEHECSDIKRETQPSVSHLIKVLIYFYVPVVNNPPKFRKDYRIIM